MKKSHYLGVDVSKNTLDLCLMDASGVLDELRIENDKYEAAKTVARLCAAHGVAREGLLVCAEHTGLYTFKLRLACEKAGVSLWVENAAQIKHCSGLTRGKDDRTDARRIADYAMRHSDRAVYCAAESREFAALRRLESERDTYVKCRNGMKAQITDMEGFMDKRDYKEMKKRHELAIAQMDRNIAEIEARMAEIIESSEELAEQERVLRTVDGVGPALARNMIVSTCGFTRFTDPRKFACHAGVAPFEYVSGTSVRSRRKVSRRADWKMKSLLHLAAMAAIRKRDGDLREYYERKVAEGKNKMSVLNAVRGKIIARMFAVIRENREYVPVYGKIG